MNMVWNSVTRSGIFFYQTRLNALKQPPPLEQEGKGAVRPDLSNFGHKQCIYGHWFGKSENFREFSF